MTVGQLLGDSVFIDGIGDIYPIKMKDYDKFITPSTLLSYSPDFFNTNNPQLLKTNSLFECIFMAFGRIENGVPYIDPLFFTLFQSLIKLATHKESIYVDENLSFNLIDNDQYGLSINKDNYDIFRETIMKQNALISPKIYKSKFAQKIAEKVIKAHTKNAPVITMEDKISTVVAMIGISFNEIKEWTIYEVENQFRRITKKTNYDTAMMFKCVSSEIPDPEYFASQIDLFEDPYAGAFKKGSTDGINKLNKSLGK
jgi:hypothetical protein